MSYDVIDCRMFLMFLDLSYDLLSYVFYVILLVFLHIIIRISHLTLFNLNHDQCIIAIDISLGLVLVNLIVVRM